MEQPKSPTYFQASRTGTYGFLAALPLFLLYEVLILFVNGNEISQIRVGADLWIKQPLAFLGGRGTFALGLLVLGIGVVIFIRERKKKIPLRAAYFGMILGESTIYAVGVALLISTLVSLVFSIAPQEMAFIAQDATRQLGSGMLIVLSIGAGLYEELIFRVVLVGGLFWVLQSLVKSKNTAYIVAAIVGALLFSSVHYVGALGDTFTMSSFVFRFLFGLALNGIFLVRGFGVTAWTHAIYDVLVVTQMFG
jgi:membrane protease YdiL (CAAX protease family)